MDLYSVTTVMKEHDGYKNASFHWFYCDARTIPRPYADLIANYNGMNRLRAAYAEGYIDDHLHWTKPKRSRTTWIELLVTKERPRSKNASCRSRKMWWVDADYCDVWKLDEVPGYPLPFKAQSCFDRGDSLAD
jgi:hypothetical protein